MSTRANILVKDNYSKQWFYRHHDGYPSSVVPSLQGYIKATVEGKIRSDVSQGSSWIIVIGNTEYGNNTPDSSDWKVGAYELTDGKHGDIRYCYTVDLDEKTVNVENISRSNQSEVLSFEEFLKIKYTEVDGIVLRESVE
jgi:hypothetical protein